MTANEIRVRPVTRYGLTHYSGDSNQGSLRNLGEFQNIELAEQAGIGIAALIPGAVFTTVEGREPQWPPEILRVAIGRQPTKWAIVERGFEVSTRAYYAESQEEAEAMKAKAENEHGTEFRIFVA